MITYSIKRLANDCNGRQEAVFEIKVPTGVIKKMKNVDDLVRLKEVDLSNVIDFNAFKQKKKGA